MCVFSSLITPSNDDLLAENQSKQRNRARLFAVFNVIMSDETQFTCRMNIIFTKPILHRLLLSCAFGDDWSLINVVCNRFIDLLPQPTTTNKYHAYIQIEYVPLTHCIYNIYVCSLLVARCWVVSSTSKYVVIISIAFRVQSMFNHCFEIWWQNT